MYTNIHSFITDLRKKRVIIRRINFNSFRLFLVQFILLIFPPYAGNRIRTWLFRRIGFFIGLHSLFFSTPFFEVHKNIFSKLIVGNYCRIGVGCYFDLTNRIIIHDGTIVGLQTTILTDPRKARELFPNSEADLSGMVEIGEGDWIGARCTILPGVKIGNGVVVAAGSVVANCFPDNVLIGGVPAKIIRQLGDNEETR